jgi:hypothetical protein
MSIAMTYMIHHATRIAPKNDNQRADRIRCGMIILQNDA